MLDTLFPLNELYDPREPGFGVTITPQLIVLRSSSPMIRNQRRNKMEASVSNTTLTRATQPAPDGWERFQRCLQRYVHL
jgi:hypothetical protein